MVNAATPERFDQLTEGELRCLRAVAQLVGKTEEIADALNYQPSTVDKYLASASRKLGVNGRRQAAKLLQQHEPLHLPVSTTTRSLAFLPCLQTHHTAHSTNLKSLLHMFRGRH